MSMTSAPAQALQSQNTNTRQQLDECETAWSTIPQHGALRTHDFLPQKVAGRDTSAPNDANYRPTHAHINYQESTISAE
jgi:hypothetical protein